MTNITTLPIAQDGTLVLPGTDRVTIADVDFSQLSAVPANISTSGGAIAGTAPAAVLRLSTTSTQYSTTTMTLPTVDTTAWEWILFSIDFTLPVTNYINAGSIEIKTGSTAGAKWNISGGALNSRNGDTDLPIGPWVGPAANRIIRRKVQMLLLPARKIIAALDDGGGVIAAATYPNFVGGVLTPTLTGQTPSAVVKTMDIRRTTFICGR